MPIFVAKGGEVVTWSAYGRVANIYKRLPNNMLLPQPDHLHPSIGVKMIIFGVLKNIPKHKHTFLVLHYFVAETVLVLCSEVRGC